MLVCCSLSFKALLFIVENGTSKLTFCFTFGEANAGEAGWLFFNMVCATNENVRKV